ncbi:hypothetical protein [Chlorobaculum limnaeum]|uniref:hypothetical protein n=1 Tax=Chlorobaculum limnaeum TaxID=274537 RepID=UPI0012EE884C|nr:hypothetical protein [Chlorobaculum limnaeum]
MNVLKRLSTFAVVSPLFLLTVFLSLLRLAVVCVPLLQCTVFSLKSLSMLTGRGSVNPYKKGLKIVHWTFLKPADGATIRSSKGFLECGLLLSASVSAGLALQAVSAIQETEVQ